MDCRKRREQFADHSGFHAATRQCGKQLPQDLYEAMGRFIESHPQWDQYRLVQVAIAGFLFQQGSQERVVAQHYLKGLFHHRPDPCQMAIDR